MKSKSTTLAATLFAAVAFSVPAAAEVVVDETLGYAIDGMTYTLTRTTEWNDELITITNGGVILMDCDEYTPTLITRALSIVITESSYLVSDSDDSTAAITGTGILQLWGEALRGDNGVTISFDSDYLADLVAGTATEYTYQIFGSNISFDSDYPFSVTIDDSWQDVSGVVSVSYDESTRTVTVVVPEPGAFGALAGISAFALVAARRRRRSRKIA